MIKQFNGITFHCDGKDEAPLKIGSRIRKVNSEEGDSTKNGIGGTIIGSLSEAIKCNDGLPPQYCYAVIWDDKPSVPISIISNKLELIEND